MQTSKASLGGKPTTTTADDDDHGSTSGSVTSTTTASTTTSTPTSVATTDHEAEGTTEMDHRIRVLGLVFIVCFALVFLELNNLADPPGAELAAAQPDRTSRRLRRTPFSQPRGEIVSSDGVVLAEARHRRTTPIGEQRSYPDGPLFADVTGYYDAVDFAATGVEAEYDNDLADHESTASTPRQILTEQSGTDNVVLTINASLQKVAQQALGGRLGAIVAINPQNGAILAMYGNPTFDPNAMASHAQHRRGRTPRPTPRTQMPTTPPGRRSPTR